MKQPTASISSNLLPVVTLAFTLGIALSPYLQYLGVDPENLKDGLFILLFAVIVLQLLRRKDVAIYLLLPLALGIGCYHGYLHLQQPSAKNHIYRKITGKTEALLIGTMATMAGFDGRTSQVTIETKYLGFAENTALQSVQGKLLLRLLGPWPDGLSPGDTLAIRAELKRPNSFRTPGTFDYAQYLARKNLWVTGFVRSPLLIHKVETAPSLLHSLRYLPERLRARLGREIDAAVPAQVSGVYRAVLIGDRSRIAEDTLKIFKGSGTMHILAISGLHMAVIGTMLYLVLFWLLSRSEKLLLHCIVQKWAAFLSLPMLIGYGLLAGMNTPVFRALIMSGVVIIAICSGRQKSPAPLLAFAALVILALDPLQLFTVSFLLSFLAILGILFLLPVIKRLLAGSLAPSQQPAIWKKVANWLFAGLLISLVANLATMPIALSSFNRFSLVGPLANIVIEPLICLWSLAAGFLAIPFLFIQPETGHFLLQLGAWGLEAAMHVASFFSSFSFSTLWLPTPQPWLLIIYYSSLITFILWLGKQRTLVAFSALSFSVCVVLFFFPPAGYRSSGGCSFRITYLDVGQGSATFLQYPSGFRLLIDGGGSSFSQTTVGERVIAPFLWDQGIRHIDAIAVTHPDADHYNGLEFIVKHFSPSILWVRDRGGHDVHFKDFIGQAVKRQVSVIIPDKGQQLLEGKESLECVANVSRYREESEAAGTGSRSNSGLVLKACADKLCALFPGDIERKREQTLVEQGANLQADILLAAHHGSITSNSSQFLRAVSPRYLLVSAGRSAKGNFPHDGLAGECDDKKISLFTTAGQGTLEVIAEETGYRVYGYAKKDGNPLSSYKAMLLDRKMITPR